MADIYLPSLPYIGPQDLSWPVAKQIPAADFRPASPPPAYALLPPAKPARPASTGLADFLVVMHRGGNAHTVENLPDGTARTMAQLDEEFPDIKKAHEADWMLTRDNKAVVHHDDDLNPALTRDANGVFLKTRGPLVCETDAATLRRNYRFGAIDPESALNKRFPAHASCTTQPIPYHSDFAAIAPGKPFFSEVKFNAEQPGRTASREAFVASFAETLPVFTRARKPIVPISFDFAIIATISRQHPDLDTAVLTDAQSTAPGSSWRGKAHADGTVPDAVAATGARYWMPEQSTLTEQTLIDAHRLGLQVIPYFDDGIDPETPARVHALIHMGCDGVDVDDGAAACAMLQDALGKVGLPSASGPRATHVLL